MTFRSKSDCHIEPVIHSTLLQGVILEHDYSIAMVLWSKKRTIVFKATLLHFIILLVWSNFTGLMFYSITALLQSYS